MNQKEEKPGLALVGERAQSDIYDEVFLNCTDGYCIFSPDGALQSYSSSYPDLYPTLKDDICVGLLYADYLRMFAQRRAVRNLGSIDDIDAWIDGQLALTKGKQNSFIHHLHNGNWVNIQFTKASSGQWLFVAFDVTQIFLQKAALDESRQLFKSFAALSSDWFWQLDENLCYVYHSTHNSSLTGIKAHELIGKNRLDSLGDRIVKNQNYYIHAAQLHNHEAIDVVLEWYSEAGAIVRTHVCEEPRFTLGTFSGYIGSARDVTEEFALKEQLKHLASHDDLTKLINRRAFEQRLDGVCKLVTQKNTAYTLCFIDLDRFKLVNDGGGHDAGDYVLKGISSIFSDHITSEETAARLGGDEFALILKDDVTAALTRVDKLIAAINGTVFTWHERNYTVGASAGLVAIDSQTNEISELLSRADASCYDAKNRGRNQAQIYIYDEYYQNPQTLEIKQVNVLRSAMDNDELLLYLQPLKSLKQNNATMRFEVLLRLLGDDKQPVSAGVFIPVAEKYDLMQTLDRWVIEQSLIRLSALHARGINVSFSINLSGNTLNNPKSIAVCESMLKELCTHPELVCFEITETSAIKNLADARNFIESIKQHGCKFALDDFGSGMSSFGYLKSLPLDYLKIDGAFVKAMQTDPTCKAIVSAFNKLSHELGMKTVAEFVEDAATVSMLAEMGVDYVQGFGVGEPKAIDEWERWLLPELGATGT
ncbi:MAG: EAL domain-containing protein [Granulosicoccus sp.]|nr:EAL domain-containing protein [Granulosicoccus sp.]